MLSACSGNDKQTIDSLREDLRKAQVEIEKKEKQLSAVKEVDDLEFSLARDLEGLKWCEERTDTITLRVAGVCIAEMYAKTANRDLRESSYDEEAIFGKIQSLNNTYRFVRDSRKFFDSLGKHLVDKSFRDAVDPLKIVELLRRSPSASESELIQILVDTKAGKKTELSKKNDNDKALGGDVGEQKVRTSEEKTSEDKELEAERLRLGITPEVRENYCKSGAVPLHLPIPLGEDRGQKMTRLIGCISGLSRGKKFYSLSGDQKTQVTKQCKALAAASSLTGKISWSAFGTGAPDWWVHNENTATLMLNGTTRNAFNAKFNFKAECRYEGGTTRLIEITRR